MSNCFSVIRFLVFGRGINYLLLITSVLIVFSSCKNQQTLLTLNNGKCLLDYKNAKTLTSKLKANELLGKHLSGKFFHENELDISLAEKHQQEVQQLEALE
jgi:hypothetical protein